MVNAMLEAPEHRPGERRHHFARQRAGEFLPDHIAEHFGQSFRGLQRHIAGKAVADDNICDSLVNIVSFHISVKFSVLARKSSPACLTVSLPLVISSPMFNRPMAGFSLPSMADTSACPISAKRSSSRGLQSMFAPRSSMVVPPERCGITAANAGRSMPASVFSVQREMAINAPVLPADTHACAWPAFTKLSAIRIDESFFLRSAISIGSSIATTSLAACTENDLERSVLCFSS